MNKFGTNVVGICSANCLNPQTLHQMPKAKRKRLYDLITTNLKNKRTGIRLAQDMERKLESYRKKRKKGFFGWFKRNPSRSEQLETLRLESELERPTLKKLEKLETYKKP
ncbi:MAG: hypothetical protein H6925_04380 [Holosporaceae bacterium]|nr:MAG: hypothetical protein H6925_04380 [Holosporaceae bacterium]